MFGLLRLRHHALLAVARRVVVVHRDRALLEKPLTTYLDQDIVVASCEDTDRGSRKSESK